MNQVIFPSAKAIEHHLQTDVGSDSHFRNLFKFHEYYSAHGLTRGLCNEFQYYSMYFNTNAVDIIIWSIIQETTLPTPKNNEEYYGIEDQEIRQITCSLARLVGVETEDMRS